MRSVIYDGGDLCVLLSSYGADKGVITFGSWLRQPLQDHPATAAKGFGDGVFVNRGVDELHIVPRRNHWYQSAEMAEVERLARSFASSRKVVTYGSSMGGYGAALMSAQLGVPAVSLAPQFTLDAGIVPWETRWREDVRMIESFDTDAMTRRGPASGYLFYDPFTGLDARQANLFRGCSDLTFVPCPFSGHATSSLVNRIYSLKRLVLEVLEGSFSVSEFVETRRNSGRERDDMYVAMLYVQAVTRKKPAVEAWAGKRLKGLEGQLGAKSLRTLFSFELRRGRKDLAAGWAEAAAQLSPATAGDCFIAAKLAAHAKLYDKAREILCHGLSIAPSNAALKQELASLA